MDFTKAGPTIITRLKFLSEENPGKPAFIFWDKCFRRTVLTRQDIWEESRKWATFLSRQGIVKGDVVCNTLPNSQERLITTYGVILAGAVSMHGQKFLADGEDLIKNLEDSKCKAIIIDPEEETGAYDVLETIKYTDEKTGKVGYKGLPFLTQIIPIASGDKDGGKNWLNVADQELETCVDETVTENDVAMIMCTSGSTGFAKLVPYSQKRLFICANNLKTLLGIKHDSVHYNERNLGWIGGAPIVYPISGCTRVVVDLIPGKTDDPGSLITHILDHEKCDVADIKPSDIQATLDHLDTLGQYKLPKLLGAVGTGGGPVSKATMKAIGRISESIRVLYGATEFGIIHRLCVTDGSKYENACCGYPAELAETKVVDENLKALAPAEFGEVLFRGPSLFPGYLNKLEVNKEVFLSDGWYRTSDIGYKNKQGQLFVICRKSHAINHQGILHYPGWIEARVNKHPDIRSSVVLGIPDPYVYEQICLCIAKAPDSKMTAVEARDFCKSLFLTNEANDVTPMPKFYLFFDSFPLNANGKIDRKATKNLALKRLQAEFNVILEH